jgi:hypothetical protein
VVGATNPWAGDPGRGASMIKVLRAAFVLLCAGAVALLLDTAPVGSIVRDFGLTALTLVGAVVLMAIAFWE